MKSKHNLERNIPWHSGCEALCQADEITSGLVFAPSTVKQARAAYDNHRDELPTATRAISLGDGHTDHEPAVEVVPLGWYGDLGLVVRDMRWRYGLDVAGTLFCDGRDYRYWYPSDSEPDRGLPQVVFVAWCETTKVYSPMLVIAAPRQ